MAFSSSDVITESLHIFTHDAFALKIDEEIQFIDPSNGSLRKYKMPKFSSIISNFPFVQFEDIAQLNPEVKIKINDFYKNQNVPNHMQLDGKCDIYAYIPFLLFDLLKDDGYIGFIVSNSWISTKAGKTFRKLLLKFYTLEYVITSGNNRWFKNTKVVTNLVVCKKRIQENNNETTSFVTTKIPLDFDTEIDNIATDIITANYQSPDIIINQYDKNTIFQMDELGLSYNYCFGHIYWLTENIKKFEKLNAYMHISRGERRGWDRLFFPSDNAVETIEEEYLRPVLKTAKGKFEYFAEPDNYAFCCDASMDELIEKGHNGALNWIRNFEKGVNKKGKPLVEVLSRKDLYWYQMEDTALADFVLSINPDTKIFIQRFSKPSFTNQRLINISVRNDNIDKELFHALLNSTIVVSQIEGLGFGRGETVLDLNPTNIKNGLYIPKIENINDSYQEKIKKYFIDIMKEPVMSIDEIIHSALRKDFDKLIFESLDINIKHVNYLYENLEILYNIRKSARK